MALPAILLKAKGAIKTGAKVKQVGKQLKGNTTEPESETSVLAKKGLKLVSLILIPTILFMIFIVVIISLPQTLFTMFGAIGGADKAEAAENCNGVVDSYINWAMDIANDDSHGYSMASRNGPDYDCSSFVWYALVEGGGFSKEELGGYAFTTESMTENLKKVGFEKYEYKGHDELQPGDILWFPNGHNGHANGHTEIYIGEGKTVGAHSARYAKPDQISAKDDGNTSNWTHYFRLSGNNSCDSTGNGKILLLAGHTFCSNCADARESKTKSGYTEPQETRKLVKKVKAELDKLGVTSDIGNALLAGDNDKMDASFFMSNAHGANKENFKKYDWGHYKYVLEVHFNGSSGNATTKLGSVSGTCLMQLQKDTSYVSKADKDIVKAITSKTGNKDYGWCATSIKNTSDQNYFHSKNIPMTYVEVEFYDNKIAMDKYTSKIDSIAKGIAEAIKKHYG